MKDLIQNGAKCLLAITVILGLFVATRPSTAKAAVISFDPQETTVGTRSTFLVGVTIDSDTPINTIRGVITIPDSMDVVNASDGNSVINFWVERPHITDAHQLVFAGIIPGGFVGSRGKLLTLTLRAKKQGTYSIFLSPSSQLYANDESATRQDIISRPLQLVVDEKKDNISNVITDKDAPESFVPMLVRIPDEGQGSWAVSFEAQDKRSGISSYEVAENLYKIDTDSQRSVDRLQWRTAQSPFILADQQLSSHVYVRAVDGDGNIRIEHIGPSHSPSWYRMPGGYILIALIILIALYVLSRRLHWKIE